MNRALILCALTASSASCATVARAPAVGQSVQSLLAPVNHGEVSPIELEGKVVLVDVWASWCQPCAEALPFYAQLQDELKAQGFVLLTINVDADRRAADAFLKSLGLEEKVRVLHDPEARQVEKNFGIVRLPTTYFVDRQGHVRSVEAGFIDSPREHDRELIDGLLKEAAPPATRM